MAGAAIGIDFGHAHIKLVEAKRRGRMVTIQRAALIPIPQGTLRNGLLAEEGVLAGALSEWNPGLRLDRAAVVAGIAGTQVTIRTLTVSDVPDNELDMAVRQELALLLRLAPEEMENYVFDYQLLPGAGPAQREVVAIGLEAQAAKDYAAMLRRAHLAAHILDVEAFALPRSMPLVGRGCYIEVGAENTQVYVTSDGEYLLYRLMPVGMRRITESVATAYGITPSEARGLLKSTHIDTVAAQAPNDRSGLQRALQELSGGIIQTLEFLRARQRSSSITELLPSALLCGGGAMQNGMPQLLSEELGIPVEVARPLTGYPGAENLSAEIITAEPLFAGALGLALRGVEEV